ncbi:MAG: hypothetical protein ACR2M0_09615 [Chloroflexia bacterium]
MKRDSAYHLTALFGYFALSLTVTYPLVARFTTEAMGEHPPDRMQNMWNLWWVKVALLDRHISPFHTDMLFYPGGADLYFHTLNLPSTLITLVPLLAFGVVGAYNFSVLFAFTMSGYAGFRLVSYLTGSRAGGLLGGVIIAFNTLMIDHSRGQINIISLQWFLLCIEFYLRAWDTGKRRDAILTGTFFTLALLTVGYFEVYLLLFFGAHLLWIAVSSQQSAVSSQQSAVSSQQSAEILRSAQNDNGSVESDTHYALRTTHSALRILAWAGGTALVLASPYLIGAWLSVQNGTIPRAEVDDIVTLKRSADLLSFIVPYREGWLLGQDAPWWAWVDPRITDTAYLGLVPMALAGVALRGGRRPPATPVWIALGALGLLLSLGPILQVNAQQTFDGVRVPMLFGLLEQVPPFSLVRHPVRFMTLWYLGLGILAGAGAKLLLERARPAWRGPVFAVMLGLLILEIPIYERTTTPMTIPASLAAMNSDPTQGAVLELPYTKRGGADAPQMLYQIQHGRPITSGYISRPIADPYIQACSTLQAFSYYRSIGAPDIITPTDALQLPSLLNSTGIGFIVVYKWLPQTSALREPVPADDLRALHDLAARLGTQTADDDTATTYRVRQTAEQPGPFLQLGPDWHDVGKSYGQPFRWMDGARADFCVFSPQARKAPLSFTATSFAAPRRLQVWVGDSQVFEANVPGDQALHQLTTQPLDWPAGPQLVRLTAPEGSASPASLGQGNDNRQLSLGFTSIRLGTASP